MDQDDQRPILYEHEISLLISRMFENFLEIVNTRENSTPSDFRRPEVNNSDNVIG